MESTLLLRCWLSSYGRQMSGRTIDYVTWLQTETKDHHLKDFLCPLWLPFKRRSKHIVNATRKPNTVGWNPFWKTKQIQKLRVVILINGIIMWMSGRVTVYLWEWDKIEGSNRVGFWWGLCGYALGTFVQSQMSTHSGIVYIWYPINLIASTSPFSLFENLIFFTLILSHHYYNIFHYSYELISDGNLLNFFYFFLLTFDSNQTITFLLSVTFYGSWYYI